MRLFTDGSVDNRTKKGCGAYVLVTDDDALESLYDRVHIHCFEDTSSSELELKTLLWALKESTVIEKKVTVYTDSQSIIGLLRRREHLEKNDYVTKKKSRVRNFELYKAFYVCMDTLECTFVKVKGHKKMQDKDATDHIFSLVDKASRKALRKLVKVGTSV